MKIGLSLGLGNECMVIRSQSRCRACIKDITPPLLTILLKCMPKYVLRCVHTKNESAA